MTMKPLVMKPSDEARDLILKKLDYLIEACKSGRIHQMVIFSDEVGSGCRMNTMLCDDDAHACAFIDRSITALQETLEQEFTATVDREVH